MSGLADAFARAAKEKRAAFIPYICAGDPTLEASESLIDALVAGGADIIELGVPFSDPIADGPVNQRAAFRALQHGTTLSDVLDLVGRKRPQAEVPMVLFTYFNPIHRMGVETFADRAAEVGLDGVLCVDVPPEEGERSLVPALRARSIDPVFLLAPTSTRERVKAAGASSGGFVYYVSRAGVTGERAELRDGLKAEVKRVRRQIKLPVAVGFGISTPDHVADVAKIADGVVVGSALVRLIEENGERPELAQMLEDRVRELVAALQRKRGLFRRS